MNKVETAKILAVLKATYPNFYRDMKKEDIDNTISIWTEMFKEEPYELISMILKEVIVTSEYPPTIATIKSKMKEIISTNEESNTGLWDILVKAIGRSGYYAEEEFNKLPDIIKEFVKSPYQLQELSQMPSDTVHSVVKGQFLKQIEILKNRDKIKTELSPEVKKYLYGEENILLNDISKEIEEL